MSARTELVDVLVAGLPDNADRRYRIIGAPDVPDGIEPKTFAIRCWQTTVEPGPALGSVQQPLVCWVLTDRKDPGGADDALDVAMPEVLTVLHRQEWVQWLRAERGVMENDNGTAWHGWRFDLMAYGHITTED